MIINVGLRLGKVRWSVESNMTDIESDLSRWRFHLTFDLLPRTLVVPAGRPSIPRMPPELACSASLETIGLLPPTAVTIAPVVPVESVILMLNRPRAIL